MRKKAYIKFISYYLPSIEVSNKEISTKFPEWAPEKILDKTGVRKRFKSNIDEFSSDLARKAAQKLFKENNLDKSQIDFIILCTQSPDYFLPTTACILQNTLGLSQNCGALDFNLGCSGYIYGLAVCKGLIESSIAKNILFITAETYSKYIHQKDKGNQTLFSDGASATLISDNGISEILDFELGTDGSGFKDLIVKEGGARDRLFTDSFHINEIGKIKTSSYLFMDGPEIFSFTSKKVPELLKKTIKKNALDFDEIELFVFHQASKFVLDHLRKKIGIPKDKFFNNLEQVGNTVSSTIPIALKDAIDSKACNGNVVLIGFGVGLSWGGVVIRFNKD